MASIDKTYVNKEQLIEAINWCKNIGEVTLEDGTCFKPLSFIYHDDVDALNDEYDSFILWNTPKWFDRWLWKNCPLTFVRERLQEQYDSEYLTFFENWKYVKTEPRKAKYTFLEIPYGRGWKWDINNLRRKNPYPHNCKQATYHCEVKVPNENFERGFNSQTEQWYKLFDMLPCNSSDYIWQKYHKNPPTKKSIIRQLNKWNLPKGTIVKFKNIRYKGLDFIILVK